MKKLFERLDLSTLKNKDSLNPSIFDLENSKMKIEVRESLMEIAKDFYEYLKIKIDFVDIWLVGSNANYNWSEYSDVDVHLMIPFNEIFEDEEFVREYFKTKTLNWNENHEIYIDEYKVETYVQDSEKEDVESGGIYSIMYDTWIRKPEHIDMDINQEQVEKNVKNVLEKFKKYLQSGSNDPKYLDELLDNLRKMRKDGLKKEGEFSAENLAFKYLRRLGLQDKIKNIKNRAYDISKSLSHGSTLGYQDSKKQKKLSGNKSFVSKKDNLTDYKKSKKNNEKEAYSDGIFYSIHGVVFSSLREASKKTGEKKSTIQYRVHSKNPKYNDYKIIYKK